MSAFLGAIVEKLEKMKIHIFSFRDFWLWVKVLGDEKCMFLVFGVGFYGVGVG